MSLLCTQKGVKVFSREELRKKAAGRSRAEIPSISLKQTKLKQTKGKLSKESVEVTGMLGEALNFMPAKKKSCMSFISALFTVALNNMTSYYGKSSNGQWIYVVPETQLTQQCIMDLPAAFAVFSWWKNPPGFLVSKPMAAISPRCQSVSLGHERPYMAACPYTGIVVNVRLRSLHPLICTNLFNFSKPSVAV